jgi:hypothetical protein
MVILRSAGAALLALALAGGPVAAQPVQEPPPSPEAAEAPPPEAPRVGSADVLVGAGIGVLAGIVILAIIVSTD